MTTEQLHEHVAQRLRCLRADARMLHRFIYRKYRATYPVQMHYLTEVVQKIDMALGYNPMPSRKRRRTR